jgi:hypothetical protein
LAEDGAAGVGIEVVVWIEAAAVVAGFATESGVVVVAAIWVLVVVAVLEGGCDDCGLANPPWSS